jgi:hypothetical protein
MKKVRLKGIRFGVDFRKSDLTNYDEFKRSRQFPGELSSNEVYLFVSKSQNQLIWIQHISTLEEYTSKRIIDTRRWRIDGSHRWNFYMLAEYASQVSLNLIGIPTLKEHFERLRR